LAKNVLLAIGRRGSPRKLGVEGEISQKVAYRLLEPENIAQKKCLVIGGGDSAIESALLLAPQNRVTLSYRGETFARCKPKNREKIEEARQNGTVEILFNTNPVKIEPEKVVLKNENNVEFDLENDLVFIFAGGELPTDFLKKSGIEITKRFGFTVKSHK
jgi:thioredoxin reductase (NADPH)